MGGRRTGSGDGHAFVPKTMSWESSAVSIHSEVASDGERLSFVLPVQQITPRACALTWLECNHDVRRTGHWKARWVLPVRDAIEEVGGWAGRRRCRAESEG